MITLDDLRRIADAPLHSWLGTLLTSLVAVLVAAAVHGLGARVVRRVARPYPITSAVVRYIDKPSRVVLAFLALEFLWLQVADALPFAGGLRHLRGGRADRLADLAAGARRGGRRRGDRSGPSARHARQPAGAPHPHPGPGARADHDGDHRDRRRGRRADDISERPSGGGEPLASAGVAGLVAGIAARPVLGNLIAGLQIALSQPIRLDDVVVIQGEWGRIEEITGTYVSVRLWDQRRLIVPLQWFIENPFANWTRNSAEIIGTVFLFVDYRLPLAPVRAELARLVAAAPEWDGRVQVLQITDATEHAMQLRALVSARDSSLVWDLRCRVREGLIAFIQEHYPDCLPRTRAALFMHAAPDAREAAPDGDAAALSAASTAARTAADPTASEPSAAPR